MNFSEMTFNFDVEMDTNGAHPVTITNVIRTYDADGFTDTEHTQTWAESNQSVDG